MDTTKYKDLKTSRGFSYNYYYSPPREDKPVFALLARVSLDVVRLVQASRILPTARLRSFSA